MLRVGGVSFINTLPLIYGLEDHPDVQLLLDTPSVCYKKLIAREVDVALIPVMGLQYNDSIRALKGLGIAAVNRTESIYLFARKPLDRLSTVATDSSSMTSVALLKIILKQKYNVTPHFESKDVDNLHGLLREYDAALVIGDDAILAEKTDYDHYDLATEWYSLARLSFVFAVWACSRPLEQQEMDLLRKSHEEALLNWDDILRQAQLMIDVDLEFLKRYYNQNLHYKLTKQDYEGLLKFISLAAECGIMERVRKDIWL
jgi:chorismate dehydratase